MTILVWRFNTRGGGEEDGGEEDGGEEDGGGGGAANNILASFKILQTTTYTQKYTQ